MNKLLLILVIPLLSFGGGIGHTPRYPFQLDQYWEILKGNLPGTTYNNKFGRNTAVTAEEDVWGCGGLFVPATAAGQVNVVSASANDAAAGTGARTITLSGLNENYAEVSESLTLNGTNNVLSANSYFFVNRIIVNTAGSGGKNAGLLTATSTAAGTPTMTCVLAGYNQTSSGIYMVPAGYTAYMNVIQSCFQNSTNDTTTDVAWYERPIGGVFNLKGDINLSKTGTSCYTKYFLSHLKYNEKSLIKFTATPSGGSSDVSVDWDIWLVAN